MTYGSPKPQPQPQPQPQGRRDADEGKGDCAVQVVSAFSDEILFALQLARLSTVLDIKRRVQATQDINIFRQRLVISPAGPQAEDHEVLAALPGLRLQLIKLEYADDKDAVDSLLRAASEGAVPEVERLLRLPLWPDCCQGFGTPLLLASARGHLEVAQLLCEAGADKDKAMQEGDTALLAASRNGCLEVARLLVEAGADKDKTNQYGATALMGPSRQGHLEVVRLLCEAGADKDNVDEDGATALMQASTHGRLEVARLLCEEGADKDKADRDGDTALMLASRIKAVAPSWSALSLSAPAS